MSSLPTYNLKGEVVEKTTLPKGALDSAVSPSLLAQAVRIYLSNQRSGGAKTKTRSMVSMTTAKMYKQKGTGKARHGSYSAPIFVGGGIAHGPTGGQNWERKLSKNMTRVAILGALALRVKENKVTVIKGAEKANSKTKEAAVLWKKISKDKKVKTLLVTTSEQKEMKRAWRNLDKMTQIDASNLSPYFILSANEVYMTAEAVDEVVKKYVN